MTNFNPYAGTQRFPGVVPSGLRGAVGDLSAKALAEFGLDLNRKRTGRPIIVAVQKNILASASADVVLKISTAAPVIVDKLVAIVDQTPLYLLATCPFDVTGMTFQQESTQTETNILVGTGNLLVVFGGNGVIESPDLPRPVAIHQGSEVRITIRNNDGVNAHDIDIALHGRYAIGPDALNL